MRSRSRSVARALYKNVGCRWPASLNFLSERPHVYMSVYMYNYSAEGPLISQQFLNVVFHKQSDLKM